jgi:serine phosphatase RsbU (regulator of sigma subunit)
MRAIRLHLVFLLSPGFTQKEETEGAMLKDGIITLLWIAGGVTGSILLYFFHDAHPYADFSLSVNTEHIETRSRAVLADLGLTPERYRFVPRLQHLSPARGATDADQAAGSEDGTQPGNSNTLFWAVRVYDAAAEGASTIRFSGSDEQLVDKLLHGDGYLEFCTAGRLRALHLPSPDTAAPAILAVHEMRERVRALLMTHADTADVTALDKSPAYAFQDGGTAGVRMRRSFSDTMKPGGKALRWSLYDKELKDSVDIQVEFTGDMLTRIDRIPRGGVSDAASIRNFAAGIIELLYYGVVSILLIVIGIRRLRAYEIGFRSALFFGGLSALLFGTWFYLQITSEAVWSPLLLLPLIVAPLIVGAAVTAVWAVGESVGRESWKEKYAVIDLLTRGHVLHSQVGHALLRGLAGGILVCGAVVFAIRLLHADGAMTAGPASGKALELFSNPAPVMFLFAETITTSLFELAFAFLFLVSFLRRKITSTVLLLPLAAVIIAAPNPLSLTPFHIGYPLSVLLVLLLLILFFSADAIATLFAMITTLTLFKGGAFLLPSNTGFHDIGLTLLYPGGVLVAYALLTFITRDRTVDFAEIAPRFQRYISERQRLSREIEIARVVQQGFLPKSDPNIRGLDIASRCVPAMEVGGDYYDFINCGEGCIGVAIGDVSGKGTQAAFYMTLTKGFLKALGRASLSPSQVLSELNRLFYENVERGHFISMIYAVFDVREMRVTLARAGHTPVMRMDAEQRIDVIQSRGMALGFDGGEQFEQTIEEVRLPLRRGDVFLLYTDGYSEAMTTRHEEFGEEGMANTLQRHAGDSAAQILDGLFREARRFAGKAVQHDDMTMVVIRISGEGATHG